MTGIQIEREIDRCHPSRIRDSAGDSRRSAVRTANIHIDGTGQLAGDVVFVKDDRGPHLRCRNGPVEHGPLHRVGWKGVRARRRRQNAGKRDQCGRDVLSTRAPRRQNPHDS